MRSINCQATTYDRKAVLDLSAEPIPIGTKGAPSELEGLPLAELAALTGWQPHTTRAALTRLRRRGFILVLGSVDSAGDRKAYRAVPA